MKYRCSDLGASFRGKRCSNLSLCCYLLHKLKAATSSFYVQAWRLPARVGVDSNGSTDAHHRPPRPSVRTLSAKTCTNWHSISDKPRPCIVVRGQAGGGHFYALRAPLAASVKKQADLLRKVILITDPKHSSSSLSLFRAFLMIPRLLLLTSWTSSGPPVTVLRMIHLSPIQSSFF